MNFQDAAKVVLNKITGMGEIPERGEITERNIVENIEDYRAVRQNLLRGEYRLHLEGYRMGMLEGTDTEDLNVALNGLPPAFAKGLDDGRVDDVDSEDSWNAHVNSLEDYELSEEEVEGIRRFAELIREENDLGREEAVENAIQQKAVRDAKENLNYVPTLVTCGISGMEEGNAEELRDTVELLGDMAPYRMKKAAQMMSAYDDLDAIEVVRNVENQIRVRQMLGMSVNTDRSQEMTSFFEGYFTQKLSDTFDEDSQEYRETDISELSNFRDMDLSTEKKVAQVYQEHGFGAYESWLNYMTFHSQNS